MKTKITLKLHYLTIIFLMIASTASGQWTATNNGLPALTTVGVANVRDTLFTAVKNHGVYYSINNGDNWTAWKHNSKLKTTNITKLEGLTAFPTLQGGAFMYIYGNSMLDFYFSQGGGSIFVNYNSPSQDINSWTKKENNGVEYDFVGTNNGVYYSTDSKKTWTQSSGLSGSGLIVNDLNIQEYDDDSVAIFASTNNGVYKSTDYGVNFTAFTAGIAASTIIYNQNVLVTTSNGMYTYSDDNDAYTSFVAGGDYRTSVIDYPNLFAYAFGNGVAKKINFTNSAVTDIAITNITGGNIISSTYVKDFLFICTENGGVFRMPKNGSLKIEDEDFLENEFNAYPNPTNGNFTIKTKEPATFNLYSIKGKMIKTFYVKNVLSNSLNLSSGIYFLKKKGSKSVKKIIFK